MRIFDGVAKVAESQRMIGVIERRVEPLLDIGVNLDVRVPSSFVLSFRIRQGEPLGDRPVSMPDDDDNHLAALELL